MSLSRSVIQDIRALHKPAGREAAGQILVEAPHPVQEAMASGLEPLSLFCLTGHEGHWPQATLVNEATMARLATTDSPPPVLGVFGLPESTPLPDSGLRLVLDGVQDPGNVGAAIRAAVAFGVTGVALLPPAVDIWHPKVIRATAGLVFRLPVVSLDWAQAAAQFQQAPVALVEAREGAVAYHHWRPEPNQVLVFGSEGNGLLAPWDNLARATRVAVPMAPGVDSLNVAATTAIVLAHAYHA